MLTRHLAHQLARRIGTMSNMIHAIKISAVGGHFKCRVSNKQLSNAPVSVAI